MVYTTICELVQENLQGEQNNIILLAIYNVHNAIYRSAEYTFYFSILSLFFSLKTPWFTGHENPPNKCAKITRQKNPPVKSTVKTCQIYVQRQPAEFTRRKNPPLFFRLLLAREPPFPAQNPQARPGPPSLPPPAAPSTEQGGGGRELARPTHASWTGTFTFIPFSWIATYSYMTQHIHILHRVDWYESITILL